MNVTPDDTPGEENAGCVLIHLKERDFAVDPDAARRYAREAEERASALHAKMSTADRRLFAMPGGDLFKPNGQLHPRQADLVSRVAGALSEVRDNDDERGKVAVPELRTLDALGFWAAAHPDLARFRDLFRAADAVRVGRVGSDCGVLRPRYTRNGGFRSHGPNLDAYRAQHIRIVRPGHGRALVSGRITALGLGVLSRRYQAEHGGDDQGGPMDGPWRLFGKHRLRDLDPHAVLAAVHHLRGQREVTREELADLADQDGVFGAPDLVGRIKNMAEAGGECSCAPAEHVRAAVETLALGLDDAYRVQVARNDFRVESNIRGLRDLDDTVAAVLRFGASAGWRDTPDRAAELLGVDAEDYETCLWRASRGGLEGGYDKLRGEPFNGRWPTREEWDEVRKHTFLTTAPPTSMRAVMLTSGRQLMLDIEGKPAPAGLALRVLALLAAKPHDEVRRRLRTGLWATGESFGKRPVGPAYPTGLRREVFLRSREDAMFAVGTALVRGGHGLVALTRDEFLLEMPECEADRTVRDARQAVDAALHGVLGPFCGGVVLETATEW